MSHVSSQHNNQCGEKDYQHSHGANSKPSDKPSIRHSDVVLLDMDLRNLWHKNSLVVALSAAFLLSSCNGVVHARSAVN